MSPSTASSTAVTEQNFHLEDVFLGCIVGASSSDVHANDSLWMYLKQGKRMGRDKLKMLKLKCAS